MNSFAIFGVIVIVLLLVVFALKYALNDKGTITDVLEANKMNSIDLKVKQSTNNFTFSVWVFVKEWTTGYNQYKPIFWVDDKDSENKGNDVDITHLLEPCISTPSYQCNSDKHVAPIMACFDKTNNDVIFAMRYAADPATRTANNLKKSITVCKISNVPIQKWVNLTFVLNNKTLDLYMNGKLSKTCILPQVPSVKTPEKATLHGTGNHFNGFTSKFQYFPQAFNTQEVWNIYSNGYGNLGSSLSDYKLQFSLIENGTVINTLTM
jgi:hypothetical protein